MNRSLIIALTALSLGSAALAQDTTSTVTLPGQITASVKAAWTAFVTAGGTATLLGADGTVIGTINADGTVTLNGTATLSDVKSVTLTPTSGDPITVNVTRDLSKPGAVKIEYTDASGRTQSLPLPAVINRLKAATSGDTDGDETGDDQASPAGKPTKEDKGGKPSTNPGKGKP